MDFNFAVLRQKRVKMTEFVIGDKSTRTFINFIYYVIWFSRTKNSNHWTVTELWSHYTIKEVSSIKSLLLSLSRCLPVV